MQYSVLSLSALILAVGMSGPHALEAVAQGSVGAGSAAAAANTAQEIRITGLVARTDAIAQQLVNLQNDIEEITQCNATGGLWNGTACVAITTPGTDTSTSSTLTIPTCTADQTLTSLDGQTLTCRNVLIAKRMGKVGFNQEVDLGPDWNIIHISGDYANGLQETKGDPSPVGGVISRSLNQAAINSGTGGADHFTLTSEYYCRHAGDERARLCFRLHNGRIFIRTGRLMNLSYTVF